MMNKNTFFILYIIGIYYFLNVLRFSNEVFFLDPNANGYDSLSQNLLHLSAEVNGNEIGCEGYKVGNKMFMYFGPFPAFIRVIPNILFPFLYGKWSRISCFIASIIILYFFSKILELVIFLNKNINNEDKNKVFYSSLFALSLGSPFVSIVSHSLIFHEAILWGLCFSVIGIYCCFKLIFSSENKSKYLLILSFCSSCALLSRVTFGIPLYLSFFFFFLNFLIKDFKKKKYNYFDFILILVPAICGILVQAWYNFDRFGSIFTFVDGRFYAFPDKEVVEFWSKNIFDFKRIPIAFVNYFGIRPEYFESFPLLKMVPRITFNSGLYHEKYIQNYKVISLLLVSPWIIFLPFGLKTLKSFKELISHIVFVLSFFVQFILIHSYSYIGHRYTVDLLPFLIILFLYFLIGFGNTKYKQLIINILIFTSAVSVINTFTSSSILLN